MPTEGRMEVALEISPVTVLVRCVLEWTFPDSRLQALYEQAPRCWTRELTIQALFRLVTEVVAGARNAVHAAYQADQARPHPSIPVSAEAVYGKLGRMPHEFGSLLVRASAEQLLPLVSQAQPREFPGLKGYRVRIIDGTDLGGTEHRLAVLRGIRAAGLPGRMVVSYDWATGLCCDAAASEDAYTSERVLVDEILERAAPKDLLVMDRYYCTVPVMQVLHGRKAHFLIRADERNLRCRTTGRRKSAGRVATGKVYEQTLGIEDTQTGECFEVRRLTLVLDEPTADGDTEVRLLTNLPPSISALRIVELYRERWTLERHFDFLKNCLHGEIESLGKPNAALFMMCMALVAGNALAVVRQAIRTIHGQTELEQLSGYYLADELAKNDHAIEVLVPEKQWRKLRALPVPAFWHWCQRVAQAIRPRAFRKHPRGPKRPPTKRASGKRRHHYSTQRLLDVAQEP
jgi:IS4 transposase